MYQFIADKLAKALIKKSLRKSSETLDELFRSFSPFPWDSKTVNSGEEEALQQMRDEERLMEETIKKIKDEILNGNSDKLIPLLNDSQIKQLMQSERDYTKNRLLSGFIQAYFDYKYGKYGYQENSQSKGDEVYVRSYTRSKPKKTK